MITGIHHVALVVRSLDDSVKFYREVLGLPLGRCETVQEQGVRAALFPLQQGEIELLEPVNPAGGVAKFLEKRGEGPHHLCVATDDIDGQLAAAKAAGVPLIDQAPRDGLAGRIGFLHPSASQGVLVELAQPGPATHHVPAAGGGGMGAEWVQTVYLGVKDLAAGAETFVRTYAGRAAEPPAEDPRLGLLTLSVQVGSGRVTLVPAGEQAGKTFGGRREGLLGVQLAVKDLQAAVHHLGARSVGAQRLSGGTLPPLVRLDAPQAKMTLLIA
ncbi:MAG: methylmalonyl-CoA epimerase [Candidatus Methylomirabilales bacterium]